MDVLVLVVLVVMQISLEFVCVSKIRLQLGISPLRKQRVTDFLQLNCMPYSLVVEVVPQLHTQPSLVYQLKK